MLHATGGFYLSIRYAGDVHCCSHVADGHTALQVAHHHVWLPTCGETVEGITDHRGMLYACSRLSVLPPSHKVRQLIQVACQFPQVPVASSAQTIARMGRHTTGYAGLHDRVTGRTWMGADPLRVYGLGCRVKLAKAATGGCMVACTFRYCTHQEHCPTIQSFMACIVCSCHTLDLAISSRHNLMHPACCSRVVSALVGVRHSVAARMNTVLQDSYTHCQHHQNYQQWCFHRDANRCPVRICATSCGLSTAASTLSQCWSGTTILTSGSCYAAPAPPSGSLPEHEWFCRMTAAPTSHDLAQHSWLQVRNFRAEVQKHSTPSASRLPTN